MEKSRDKKKRVCSVDRTLGIIGDRWTFLVIREAFFGVRHYDKLLHNTGMATNILSDRLARLVKHEILRTRKDPNDARRKEYRLTEKGLELYSITLAIMQWGDRWLSDGNGPPLTLVHKSCGKPLNPEIRCAYCGQAVNARDVAYRENYVMQE